MEVLIRILCVGFAIIPVTCFENLAQMTRYRGHTSQSSAYPNQPWTADKAVDGQLQQDDDLSSCSITKDWTSTVAWWKFPLKETANVAYLEIHFRKGTVNRHVGFSVFVFDDTGFTPPSSSPNKVFTQAATPCPTPVLNVTVNRATRGIALFNTKETRINTSCEGYRYGHHYSVIQICEVRVMGCPYGQFGENCARCGLCEDGLCDVYNGSCIQGCSTHVREPPLCVDCKNGLYGNNCTQTCAKCQTGTYCDGVNGTCPAGCQDHWSGSKCDVCRDGFYGPDCTLSCGQCRPGTHCNKTTGSCTGGCQRNWDGIKCDVCRGGFYGSDCILSCGQCRLGTHCNKTTGSCTGGCQKNWNGIKCDECNSGYHLNVKSPDLRYRNNSDCWPCGNCRYNLPCNTTSGHCSEGCHINFQPPYCTELKTTDQSNANPTTTIIISLLSILLVFAVVIVAIQLRMRKEQECHRPPPNTERNTTGTGSQMQDEGASNCEVHEYVEINRTGEDHAYDKVDRLNESPYSEIDNH